MAKVGQLNIEFVKSVPDKPTMGTLYVSMEYASVMHLCCCGCGNEVVTPLSPKDWKLTFNGESITLHPSIGNWSFPCRSHYWIRSNLVQWAGDMTDQDIREVRTFDRLNRTNANKCMTGKSTVTQKIQTQKMSFWKKLRSFFD